MAPWAALVSRPCGFSLCGESGAGLFQSLSRSRPEWIAQGLFMHAVERESAVRQLVIETLLMDIPIDLVPNVTEEVPRVEDGWRRDVVISWPGFTEVSVELKLLAPFTPRQRSAKIGLIVARTREGGLDGVPCLTWAELVPLIEDPVVRELVRQVSEFRFAMELPSATLSAEFTSFMARTPESRWPTIYRFLSTVHACLYDAEHPTYQSSNGWSKSRQHSDPWYGYKFLIGNSEFWLGFVRDSSGPFFALYAGTNCLLTERDAFDARELAQRVLESARQDR